MTPNAGNIYVPGKVRTTQSPLYDSYSIALGAAMIPGGLLKMFGNVQGLAGVGPETTNMQQAFTLSGGETFLVRSMRVVPVGCAIADWLKFCKGFTVRLIAGAGSTIFGDAPADYWAAGAGSVGDVTNGVPDPRAINSFDIDPVLLTDGINFRVEIVGTSPGNAAAAFFYRVYLDGQRTQPAS